MMFSSKYVSFALVLLALSAFKPASADVDSDVVDVYQETTVLGVDEYRFLMEGGSNHTSEDHLDHSDCHCDSTPDGFVVHCSDPDAEADCHCHDGDAHCEDHDDGTDAKDTTTEVSWGDEDTSVISWGNEESHDDSHDSVDHSDCHCDKTSTGFVVHCSDPAAEADCHCHDGAAHCDAHAEESHDESVDHSDCHCDKTSTGFVVHCSDPAAEDDCHCHDGAAHCDAHDDEDSMAAAMTSSAESPTHEHPADHTHDYGDCHCDAMEGDEVHCSDPADEVGCHCHGGEVHCLADHDDHDYGDCHCDGNDPHCSDPDAEAQCHCHDGEIHCDDHGDESSKSMLDSGAGRTCLGFLGSAVTVTGAFVAAAL